MKYCIQYYRNFKYFNDIDEIIITYNDKDVNVLNFLEQFSETKTRIILDANKIDNIEDNLNIFIAAREAHKNLAIKIKLDSNEALLLYENNIPFFFDEFVDNWDTLISFINAKVSDVYIVNELGFELKDVSRVCKENNVNIRVFPNVAQTGSKIKNLETIKSFFIRPEDIDIYEPYVDVCEFFGPLDRQSVLYDIYTDKKWIGDLRELIIGLKEPLKSKYLMPCFGEERLNCGKKCYQDKCIICDKISTIAKQLEEANLEIKIEEKENEYQINEASNENKTG